MKQDDVRMLAVELPEDILKAKWAGDFKRADRLIDWYLRSDRVPEFMKKRLLVEREILEHLPEGIRYMGRTGWPMFTAGQQQAADAYEKGEISFEAYWEAVRDAFALERKRNFGDMRIDRLEQVPAPGKIGPESTIEELEFSLY